MANPFTVAVPNIYEALLAGDQGYKGMRGVMQERAQQQASKEAEQALMSGGDTRGALARLIGARDYQGAQVLGSLGKADTTDDIKEWKLAQSQGYKGSLQDWIVGNKRAGATNVQTNVNATVNPVLKGISDRYNESVEAANASRGQIESIHEARRALDEGAITGAFADKKLFLTKAAGMFGLPQEAAANTEIFRSAVGNQVLSKAKTLGANPTNTDRDYIEKVVGGQIELNEASIRRLLDIQERWGREGIRRTNARGQQLLKAYPNELGRVGDMLNVDEPPSYQDYIKAAPNRGNKPAGGPQNNSGAVPWQQYFGGGR